MDVLGTGGSIWNADDSLSRSGDRAGSEVVSEAVSQRRRISAGNKFQMEKKQGQERE